LKRLTEAGNAGSTAADRQNHPFITFLSLSAPYRAMGGIGIGIGNGGR
jgi:hypothetical protein